MRLTHNICTDAKMACLMTAAEIRLMQTAMMFTVSWNCKNLRIDKYTFLPHTTALTIDWKLSSSKIMSEAFLETCVPVIPIAIPISALISAGASFAPSPVTPTICPNLFIPSTNTYLCSGLLRAITTKLLTIDSNYLSYFYVSNITFFILLKLPPSFFSFFESFLAFYYFRSPFSSRICINYEAYITFPPWPD